MAVTPEPSLCPMGVWMTEEDVMECHNIKAKVMRVYRNEAPPANMHFETGAKVGAPNPYNQHRFVYISQEGTEAHFGNITLRIWSKMCDYFSNNTIQTDAAADDEQRGIHSCRNRSKLRNYHHQTRLMKSIALWDGLYLVH